MGARGSARVGLGFPGGSQQLKEKSQGWEHSLDLTRALGSEEQQTVFSATEASQQVDTRETVHLSTLGLLPGLGLWGSESRNAETMMCDRSSRP